MFFRLSQQTLYVIFNDRPYYSRIRLVNGRLSDTFFMQHKVAFYTGLIMIVKSGNAKLYGQISSSLLDEKSKNRMNYAARETALRQEMRERKISYFTYEKEIEKLKERYGIS